MCAGLASAGQLAGRCCAFQDSSKSCTATGTGLGTCPCRTRNWILFFWWNALIAYTSSARKVPGTVGRPSLSKWKLPRSLAGIIFTNLFVRHCYESVLGIPPPPDPALPETPHDVDFERYTGEYRDVGTRADVTAGDGELVVQTTSTQEVLNIFPAGHFRAIDDDWFVEPMLAVRGPIQFCGRDAANRPRYLNLSGRMLRRIDW
jgi:hypothetical protein